MSLVARAFAPLRREKGRQIVPATDRRAEPSIDDDLEPQPKRKINFILWSFILVFGLPTFVSGVYLFFISSNQYVADARFAVRRVDASPDNSSGSDTSMNSTDLGATVSSMGGGKSLEGQDAEIVASYIHSRDIIEEVSKTVNIRAIFQRPEADFWARLPQDASVEGLRDYWKKMIYVYIEPSSAIVEIAPRAFRREDALTLAKAILAASEALANRMSIQVRTDLTALAEGEVIKAEGDVRTALANLTHFRDTHQLIDPTKAADSTTAILTQLIASKIQTETQLFVSEKAGIPNAPGTNAVKAQLESINNHINDLQQQMAGQKHISKNLAATLSEYEALDLKRQFAEKLLTIAETGVETARLTAMRQLIYLAIYAPPSLPEDYMYPQRMTDVSLIAVVALLLWITGLTIAASILDHRI